MDGRWVSAVALYGPKTGEVRNLLECVQATIKRQLGAAFLPYSLEQIHGTLIGLNAVREPATGALISQYYLEHQGTLPKAPSRKRSGSCAGTWNAIGSMCGSASTRCASWRLTRPRWLPHGSPAACR